MEKGSTLLLRLVILLIGALILGLCIFILPRLIVAELAGDFDYLPIFIGMYVPSLPFFYGLFQTLKLLSYIDKNQAFSELSVNALKKIKYCAASVGFLYAAGMPYIFYVADQDDAPGLVALGFFIVFASGVFAVFTAVLQKLLQNAIDIKSENDLTV